MAKRLVEIDDHLLVRARSIAGTDTIKETLNAGLQRLVDDGTMLRHIERLRGSGALNPARIDEARRPHTESREVAMVTVDIHEAKRQLSKLVDQAAKGETFAIAKAGRPLVKVVALDAPATPQRLGFLAGEIVVPDDFDRMSESEIPVLFGIEA